MKISYGHQFIAPRDIKEVVKILRSDWLTQGPQIKKFENALAHYCGAKYAVVVSSGTAALHLAYLAAGLKKGDEVITTPNTFVATTNMLLAVEVKPVFCDIRLDTYNIDETKIEKLINKKTKAIVPVHFAGQPCEMEMINQIAQKNKLLIIEDSCHALGAKYKNSRVGGCKYSDMSVFSFHPVKSITTGEGGAILTNNECYYKKLLLFRSHGTFKDKNGKNVMVQFGYNYRLTDIQAALGLSQLEKLENFIKKRCQIVGWYVEGLKDCRDIVLPRELPHNHSSWNLFVIRTTEEKQRDRLSGYLKKMGIGVNFHYPSVCSHPFYKVHGYGKNNCPMEDEYALTTITLPLYPLLSKDEVNHICRIIKEFYER